jgi:signal transduction histidine kinase
VESGGEPIARAIAELGRLAGGVESVLHWAVGDRVIRRRLVDLAALLREAVDCCVAETGDDRVVVEGDDQLWIHADPLHLRSAIENPIRNALRFSTPGTKVRVTVERHEEGPTIEFENEGPGISPDDRERIFEPLVRGPDSWGTGLGLFVTRRVLESHGGTIRCYQPDETHLVFQLRLPPEALAS